MFKKNDILVIDTGGTFNKHYNAATGTLEVDTNAEALRSLSAKWFVDMKFITLIGKDSLDINTHDRMELLATISHEDAQKIIIIHGTDTMDLTARYLADAELEKSIVLTGAMIPYSIDPVEATANFAAAAGAMHFLEEKGVFISMHGIFAQHDKIKKDRKKGKYILL